LPRSGSRVRIPSPAPDFLDMRTTSDRPPKGGLVIFISGKRGGSSGSVIAFFPRSNFRTALRSGAGVSHRVPICCVACSKWASRLTVRNEAAPARPPEPTSAAPAKRFQCAVDVEHFDANAGPRVDVEEWLMACALSRVGCGGPRRHHAALSAASARAKPRR
jgi:hypothetical protein